MPISKVVYGNNTLIDLSSDTVDAEHLLNGYTAHNSAGTAVTGSYVVPTITNVVPDDTNPPYLAVNNNYKVTNSSGYLYATQQSATLKQVTIDNSGGAWSSLGAREIDVASALPDDYTRLTIDNFSFSHDTSIGIATTTQSGSQPSVWGSYDSSTGILHMNKHCPRGGSSPNYYYRYYSYKIVVTYI